MLQLAVLHAWREGSARGGVWPPSPWAYHVSLATYPIPCTPYHVPCTTYPVPPYHVPSLNAHHHAWGLKMTPGRTLYPVPCTMYCMAGGEREAGCLAPLALGIPRTTYPIPCTLYHVPCTTYPVPRTTYLAWKLKMKLGGSK